MTDSRLRLKRAEVRVMAVTIVIVTVMIGAVWDESSGEGGLTGARVCPRPGGHEDSSILPCWSCG